MSLDFTHITIASTNLGKIREFNALLAPIHCIPNASDDTPVAETGLSFVENALIKARSARFNRIYPVLADDSGLVVPALDGAPGIFSARFAHEHANDAENIAHLLNQMQAIPSERRQAYFYCALVVMGHPNDPTPLIATGRLEGIILDSPRGTNGFGYDPIFYLPTHQCTLAELNPQTKNQLSHRASACQQLHKQLGYA
ncbi:MAG: non-canonical purine NTP pyrophosphatase, RdgB/HAM1 family [Verrucomicrobia bacterium 21-51-4]|nr:MAG: non-canonical purine NTP pyrophosphatase, RdgB/HAM1 family [Verrucomicrobia bacterium 21-51-4]